MRRHPRFSHFALPAAAAMLGGWIVLGGWAGGGGAGARVVVGSKNFEESRMLGEIFAQLIEARTHLRVERRLGLAGTQICFEALKGGAIDVYPEYTGTGLVSILGERAAGGGGQPSPGSATATLRRGGAGVLGRTRRRGRAGEGVGREGGNELIKVSRMAASCWKKKKKKNINESNIT